MGDTLLWVLSTVLIVVGVAGTVLPALPGTLFVLAGIVLGAWIDDFTRVGWGVVSVVTVLAVLAWVLDYVAGLLGARKAGASKQAIIGAALGTVAGIFMGLVGALHAAGGRCGGRVPGAQGRAQRRQGGRGHVAGHHGRAGGQGGARLHHDRPVRGRVDF